MRGAKWMNEAEHLSDADKAMIMREVEQCQEFCKRMVETDALLIVAGDDAPAGGVLAAYQRILDYQPDLVGVRPAAYTGEPHPIAAITYGPGGGRAYGYTYRDGGWRPFAPQGQR